MSTDPTAAASDRPPLPAVRVGSDEREQTVARLSDAYARDMLPMAEFERRISAVYSAQFAHDLAHLVADLPTAAARTDRAMAVERGNERRQIRARLSSVLNPVISVMPALLEIDAVLGSVELDLTRTIFPDGVTELHVRATLANVVIAVPNGVRVEIDGEAVLGTFSYADERPSEVVRRSDATAVLRITGRAVLGTVEVAQYLATPMSAESHARE
jgi:Domain of unknown function (DUF1707)/Cell wall-active antibiotics response 4TMS YvqF